MKELRQKDILTISVALATVRDQVKEVSGQPGYLRQLAVEECLELTKLTEMFRDLQHYGGPSYQLTPVPEGTSE